MWAVFFSWGPCAGRAKISKLEPLKLKLWDEFLPIDIGMIDDHKSNPRNPLQNPFYKPRSAEVGMSKDVLNAPHMKGYLRKPLAGRLGCVLDTHQKDV